MFGVGGVPFGGVIVVRSRVFWGAYLVPLGNKALTTR